MDKQKLKRFLFLVSDVFFFTFSFLTSLLLCFDFSVPHKHQLLGAGLIIGVILIKLGAFCFLGMYKRIWTYTSVRDAIHIIAATIIANVVSIMFISYFVHNFPVSFYFIMFIIDSILVCATRIGMRIIDEYVPIYIKRTNPVTNSNVLIIGAGKAGSVVIKEFFLHPEMKKKIVAVVDDDNQKQGMIINNIKVVGKVRDIKSIVKNCNVDEIIIAIPTATKNEIKTIVDECKQVKCSLKILPGVYELINGSASIQQIRKVEIEDLLGRDPIKLDMHNITEYVKGKTVLVTGGGGSIGSELCRQISKYNPKTLIIFDIYENNAYDIQNELRRNFPKMELKVVIGSIRDRKRVEELFKTYKVQIVFHAAAHKHVPLMEFNPGEAVKNNVFGTLNVAEMADRYKVEKFVMISTDKAVNPTNIMGATKRTCEMIIQSIDKVSKTEFVAVRFGNVLGSNGSVIPLFKRQIAHGGPVTITHPDIIRYFMTIPEAVQLVLQAATMANGGEIFVLDMGKPVKIDTLARDLIKLSGFEPDVDINVVYTGLRPGEKLFEELLMAEEGLTNTDHKKIFIAKAMDMDYDEMKQKLDKLRIAVNADSRYENVKRGIKEIVTTYIEPGEEMQSKVSNYDKVDEFEVL